MPEEQTPRQAWRPRRSFANPDPRALKLAELLHEGRSPQLTILFGSRARGDYAEGRSDVDIMLVEDSPLEGEAAEESAMAFRKAKAEIYRGQDIESRWKLRTLEEFRERTKFVNSLETAALKDGHVLGDDAEFYSALSRMREANSHIRQANRQAKYLENQDGSDSDDRQGGQAYLAINHALMAAVTAAGEWCPDLHDVEMLLEIARQADPGGRYVTVLDPEIYTQYSDSRREIPPEKPFTSRPEHRVLAIQDVQAVLARTDALKKAWPAPSGEAARTEKQTPMGIAQ